MAAALTGSTEAACEDEFLEERLRQASDFEGWRACLPEDMPKEQVSSLVKAVTGHPQFKIFMETKIAEELYAEHDVFGDGDPCTELDEWFDWLSLSSATKMPAEEPEKPKKQPTEEGA